MVIADEDRVKTRSTPVSLLVFLAIAVVHSILACTVL